MRLFFSISPPDDFKNKVRIIQDRFRGLAHSIFVEAEPVHVTILFLGEVSGHLLKDLEESAAQTALEAEPFELTAEKIGSVNSGSAIIFKESASFDRLRTLLLRRLEKIPSLTSGIDFHEPHLTLFRTRGEEDEKAVRKLIFDPKIDISGLGFTVTSFFLVQSTLTPSGPIYHNLCESCLNKINNAT